MDVLVYTLIVPTAIEYSMCLLCMLDSLSTVEVTGRRSPPAQVGLFIGNVLIGTQTHLNVITHFLWEGPVEPRQPSQVAAAVVWTTSITVPQWVINSEADSVSTSETRFTKIILPNKCRRISTWRLSTGAVMAPTCKIFIII